MFLLIRLLLLPVTLALGIVKLSTKAGYRTGRLMGYRRIFVFALGVGAGLLLAPTTGQEARDRLRKLIEERKPSGPTDLAERVRRELASSPRTWHLPQPSVEVVSGTAILRGEVPHETGRAELERTAAAVAGIIAVDNHLQIASAVGTNGAG